MANSIALVGASGSGKTYSFRNLPPEETVIISPYKMNLSFGGAKKNYTKFDQSTNPNGNFWMVPDLGTLPTWLGAANDWSHIKYVIIEDYSHYMTNYLMSGDFRGKANGKQAYSRFEQFAADVYQSLFGKTPYMRDDLWLIYVFHDDTVETNVGPQRKIRITAGRMLDEKVDLPSYFSYVVYTEVSTKAETAKSDRFKFRICNDGYSPAKMPPGVFDEDIETVPNDMKALLESINDFELNG
jgi:hypothetical protein